jgi:hypothetical protein
VARDAVDGYGVRTYSANVWDGRRDAFSQFSSAIILEDHGRIGDSTSTTATGATAERGLAEPLHFRRQLGEPVRALQATWLLIEADTHTESEEGGRRRLLHPTAGLEGLLIAGRSEASPVEAAGPLGRPARDLRHSAPSSGPTYWLGVSGWQMSDRRLSSGIRA